MTGYVCESVKASLQASHDSSNFSFDCPCSSPLKDLPYKQVENADKCVGITRVEGAWETHQVYDLVVDDPFKSNPSYEERYSNTCMSTTSSQE